jgi:cAMP-dependent protein kinase regulator
MSELLELAPVRIGSAEQPTKLLTELSAKGFTTLVEECELRQVAEGDLVVRQGESGREMFLIANGRALVHATRPSGDRVYLASLTSGDFFGENGFFSGAPRAASVEALYPMQAFVITPALYTQAAADNARADATLLAFYKERVVDVVLATSNVFGLLPHEARRQVLDRFQLRSFRQGDLVLREGETSDDIYVIKSGEARVYNGHDTTTTELSTLGPGTIFGEVAALWGVPRTASIEARTDLTTLVLSKTDFSVVLDQRPALRKKVMDVIASRVRENLDKLMVR